LTEFSVGFWPTSIDFGGAAFSLVSDNPTGLKAGNSARRQTGDSAGTCASLSAFLNEVQAQSGKKLSVAQAQKLTAAANDIRAQIGC